MNVLSTAVFPSMTTMCILTGYEVVKNEWIGYCDGDNVSIENGDENAEPLTGFVQLPF